MSATPPRRWARTARRCSRRPTILPSTPTARSGRPARWPNSRTASSPRGRRRRRRTICASSSRRCSRMPARERALHLYRGLRLLRPQRPRGRGGRCRAARQGGRASRCACNGRAPTSTAGIRKGPPTLIDLRAAMDAAGRRQGVAIRILHSAADGRRLQRAAHRRDARLECRRTITPLPATSFRTRRSPTSSPM